MLVEDGLTSFDALTDVDRSRFDAPLAGPDSSPDASEPTLPFPDQSGEVDGETLPFPDQTDEVEGASEGFPIDGSDPDDLLIYDEEAEIQAGLDDLAAEYPGFTREEIEALATEPDGSIRIKNIGVARAALEAKRLGIIQGDLLPSNHMGNDFIEDGNPPTEWDIKGFPSKYGPHNFANKLDGIERNDLHSGENILFDTSEMTEGEIQALESELANRPKFEGRYKFVPPR